MGFRQPLIKMASVCLKGLLPDSFRTVSYLSSFLRGFHELLDLAALWTHILKTDLPLCAVVHDQSTWATDTDKSPVLSSAQLPFGPLLGPLWTILFSAASVSLLRVTNPMKWPQPCGWKTLGEMLAPSHLLLGWPALEEKRKVKSSLKREIYFVGTLQRHLFQITLTNCNQFD